MKSRVVMVVLCVVGASALRPWRAAVAMVRGGAEDGEDEALFGEEGQQSISDLLGGLSGLPEGFNSEIICFPMSDVP